MWNPFRPKQGEVLKHWYALIPEFKLASKEFYEDIEGELKERQVPGLQMSGVEFQEGGPLSHNRMYLRMTRERLVFDVCASPFGTAYFFSCRFAEMPVVVHLAEILGVLFLFSTGTVLSFVICAKIFGFMAAFIWPAAFLGCIAVGVYTLRNAVAMGLRDLDTTLINFPLVGRIYQAWFRKETYYREDTRLMYIDMVDSVVKAKVEEATGAKGIKFVRFNENDPILGELYKPRMVKLSEDRPQVADEPCLA